MKRNLLNLMFSLVILLGLTNLYAETMTHASALDFNFGSFSSDGIVVTEDGSLKLGFSASDTLPEYHI